LVELAEVDPVKVPLLVEAEVVVGYSYLAPEPIGPLGVPSV